ncbi:tyrosine-type recombinase/integrase [Rhizobium sp. SG2393]|uniref:tyrosine-type recombinase/integrase n=1 Tax=Rhizobium sp. SG2393 TaxID=3276279 RepID=UPI003671E5AE
MLTTRIAAGGSDDVEATDLLELLDRYGAVLWEDGRHRSNVTAFITDIHMKLRAPRFLQFSQRMLDDAVSRLKEAGNSNATVNRKLSALSKLLRKAYRMGDIGPLPEFTRQKERQGRIRFLEQEEEERLFSAIGAMSDIFRRLCIFLVDTGARFGEALGLRWNDIHGRMATFWITKSGRSRSVPLTERAQKAIAASGGRSLGPFYGIDRQQFRKTWLKARQQIGLSHDKDLVPHVLRHTCASRLVRGGIDIRRVQMWLGHQTLTMTMRYAHLASGDLAICIPVLEKASQREIRLS